MSIASRIVYTGFKISGITKLYDLPQEEFLRKAEKLNRNRSWFWPKDKKAVYKKAMALEKYPAIIIQKEEQHANRSLLFLFGGGMILGPDKGDFSVARKMATLSHCDVWFLFYPLCTEHPITEAYEASYDLYRQMVGIYGDGNVSTCGFSSGGMLALGVAAHNNAQGKKLPPPRHIVAVSPGEVPWNDDERRRMQSHSGSDIMVSYSFMERVEKFMRHGRQDIPDYMIHGSLADLGGVGDIHFFYSEDEILYGALPEYESACKRAGVPYTVTSRPAMVHCYCMLPYFKEAKEDFVKICDILKT